MKPVWRPSGKTRPESAPTFRKSAAATEPAEQLSFESWCQRKDTFDRGLDVRVIVDHRPPTVVDCLSHPLVFALAQLISKLDSCRWENEDKYGQVRDRLGYL